VIITAKILVVTVCKTVLGLKPFVTGYPHSARLNSEGIKHTAGGGRRVTVADLSPSFGRFPVNYQATRAPYRLLSRSYKMLLAECAIPRGPVASYPETK